MNILIDETPRQEEEKADEKNPISADKKLQELRIKVYQILKILFENTEEGIKEFCNKKDAIRHFIQFP